MSMGTRAHVRTMKVRINESVIQAEVDDEVLLLDVDNGAYFGLDGVGTRIWQLLTVVRTVEAVTNQLAEEYEVARTQLDADVQSFLNTLREKGLIQEVGE